MRSRAMQSRLVLVTLTTLLLVAVGEIDAGFSKVQLEQYDAVWVARCIATCGHGERKEKEACLTVCLSTDFVKAGACPDAASLSVLDATCVDACTNDTECQATDKCCANTCGVTCQTPQGLEEVEGLPPRPYNVTVNERRRGRRVLITWSGALTGVAYLLEERHHAGRHFSAPRLGAWQPRYPPVTRAVLLLKHAVKPGRWYQFRLAAVNENGTRGFSEPTMQFTLSATPKAPRAPEKLSVGALTKVNGTFCVELSWKAPRSDLPIQRYKVFWSRQLHGASGPLVSVLVNHQTVGKDVTKFTLKRLEPKSMYFLQVQALSQYGRERLKGEKSAMVINTTLPLNASRSHSDIDSGSKRSAGRVGSLRAQRMFWRKKQLFARIAWVPVQGHNSRYTVTWSASSCQGVTPAKRTQLAATTETPTFDLYDLGFVCKYRVSVKHHGSGNHQQDASLILVTPSCEEFAASITRGDKPSCPPGTTPDAA